MFISAGEKINRGVNLGYFTVGHFVTLLYKGLQRWELVPNPGKPLGNPSKLTRRPKYTFLRRFLGYFRPKIHSQAQFEPV